MASFGSAVRAGVTAGIVMHRLARIWMYSDPVHYKLWNLVPLHLKKTGGMYAGGPPREVYGTPTNT